MAHNIKTKTGEWSFEAVNLGPGWAFKGEFSEARSPNYVDATACLVALPEQKAVVAYEDDQNENTHATEVDSESFGVDGILSNDGTSGDIAPAVEKAADAILQAINWEEGVS